MNRPSLASIEAAAPGAASSATQGRLSSWNRPRAAIAILAAATLAAHGLGLFDGLFLDDHLHVSRLRSPDWSLNHLLHATTIIPSEFMDTWWQEQHIQWQYARPFSMLLSKVVYQFSGGSVKALHALSLTLHFLGALLVYGLCRQLTRRPGWSLVGALLFVIHSHSVYAVGWLAAQNSVLQTVLTLAALQAYIRASRLDIYAGDRDRAASSGGSPHSVIPETGAPPPPLHVGWLGVTLLCWMLAVLSRENALVFPAFAVAFDWVFGGKRHWRRRLGVYALMGILAGAYAFWRLKIFYVPMPAFYVRRFDGMDYPWWWLAKLLHWVTGVVWLSPLMVGPSARFNPFREVPGDCLLMIGIVGIMFTGYFLACRRARGWWIWPVWIFLSLLPVVPVFAGPQSAYMPSVGFAVGMVLGAALRREVSPAGIGKWGPAVAVWFLVATSSYIPVYRTFWVAVQSAEQLTVSQMAADPPEPDTDVFLINVPFVNIYARLHLAEELAAAGAEPRDFRCHVLTYAPNVLRMEEDCRLEQTDAHTFRLSVEGRGYFSGAMGRYLIESMRPSGPLQAGDRCQREHFSVEVVRADAEGVQELQFRFREPLVSPKLCFYLGTNQQPAARVHFWGPETKSEPSDASSPDVTAADIASAMQRFNAGQAGAAEVLFRAMTTDDPDLSQNNLTLFRQSAYAVAHAMAAPISEVFSRPYWTAEEELQVRTWWRASVRDHTLQVLWVRRHEWHHWQHARDRLFKAQEIAGRIIRTDLYMTGPPFPSPRQGGPGQNRRLVGDGAQGAEFRSARSERPSGR